jgi:hypothetical protein
MELACVQCGAPVKAGANFCGACGAAAEDDPGAVARYREVLERFLADGPLEAAEIEQLGALRARLGLRAHTHDLLVDAIALPDPVRLRLAVDASTIRHFEVGARCMVRLQVHNDGDLALERLEVHAEVFGEETLPPSTVETLFPGRAEVVTVWLVPRVAGFQELRGVLHAVDLAGERSAARFEGVRFRVGGASDAPRISVVHVDQRSARVVDNSRSSFAPAEAPGGLVSDEAVWHPVPLRPLALPQAPRIARGGAPRFTVKAENGEYQVDRHVARGDLATVFGGRRARDGLPVVVKVADDRADNDLMQAEVSTLRLLRSEDSPQLKHLPVVLDQFETPDGRLGTVFERIDGLDLTAIRERLPGGVPPRHMIWLMRRCLSVLGRAHALGVLHGNLDPAHVMVRPKDHNVWLVDWTCAIVNPAQTGQGFRVLNEVYGPPEVAARKPPMPSSDLYSLGKTMVYAAGGDPAEKTLPDAMDERLQRFVRFMVLESQRGRAQDAWELYTSLDRLRAEIWGAHQFVEFEV